MTLVAGLAVGGFMYVVVGFLTGQAPAIKVRRVRRHTQISNRQLWLDQAGVEVVNTHCSLRRGSSRVSFQHQDSPARRPSPALDRVRHGPAGLFKYDRGLVASRDSKRDTRENLRGPGRASSSHTAMTSTT